MQIYFLDGHFMYRLITRNTYSFFSPGTKLAGQASGPTHVYVSQVSTCDIGQEIENREAFVTNMGNRRRERERE
jgi:hypothetical protein